MPPSLENLQSLLGIESKKLTEYLLHPDQARQEIKTLSSALEQFVRDEATLSPKNLNQLRKIQEVFLPEPRSDFVLDWQGATLVPDAIAFDLPTQEIYEITTYMPHDSIPYKVEEKFTTDILRAAQKQGINMKHSFSSVVRWSTLARNPDVFTQREAANAVWLASLDISRLFYAWPIIGENNDQIAMLKAVQDTMRTQSYTASVIAFHLSQTLRAART